MQPSELPIVKSALTMTTEEVHDYNRLLKQFKQTGMVEDVQGQEIEKDKYQFKAAEKMIKKACIFPQFDLFENFYLALEKQEGTKNTFNEALKKFNASSTLEQCYFLRDDSKIGAIANEIE